MDYEDFRIGPYTGYFPYPEEQGIEAGKRRNVYDENGQLCAVVARIQMKDGTLKTFPFYPLVYFCHENGFIIGRRQSWREYSPKVMGNFNSKYEEVVGRDLKLGGGRHILTRFYRVLKTQMDSDGYLRVDLYSDLCNHTKKKFYVHHLVLITFRGRRPEGCVSHHGNSDVQDNRLVNLAWILLAENSMLANLFRDRKKFWTLSTLEIISTYWRSGEHDWWEHPFFKDILVSGDGTHVYHLGRKRYIPIQKRISTIDGKITFRITFTDAQKVTRTRNFCRFVLEAHIGKELSEKLTVDHANQNREDNAVGNLLDRGVIFQNNNQTQHRQKGPREDGSLLGVFRDNKDLSVDSYWKATASEYTPVGPTASRGISDKFSTKTYGEKGALQMANDWRMLHSSNKGMNYHVDVVPPTYPKKTE